MPWEKRQVLFPFMLFSSLLFISRTLHSRTTLSSWVGFQVSYISCEYEIFICFGFHSFPVCFRFQVILLHATYLLPLGAKPMRSQPVKTMYKINCFRYVLTGHAISKLINFEMYILGIFLTLLLIILFSTLSWISIIFQVRNVWINRVLWAASNPCAINKIILKTYQIRPLKLWLKFEVCSLILYNLLH